MPINRILAILLILAACGFSQALWAQDSALRAPPGFALHPAPKPIADFRFLDDKGQTRRLSEFKGRVVLLNLWATWCPTCREEMPALDRVQEALGPEGMTVLAISMDKKGVALVGPYYRESNIKTLPMFFDPQWELRKVLGVEGLPASILISRDGWEITRVEGWRNWSAPEMLVFLRNLLQRPN